MSSYWLNCSNKKKYKQLEENISTDILIIGGGITGISLAYELSKLNKNIVLVEQNELYHGTTGYTTGKVTYQHGFIYSYLIKEFGYDYAIDYYKSNLLALDHLKQIIKKNEIDCDFTDCQTLLFNNAADDILLIKEEKAYQKISINYERANFLNYPALKISNQGHFNIVKYLDGLLKYLNEKNNVTIFEKTRIIKTDINDKRAFTDKYQIDAQIIISASFYPIYKNFNFFFTNLKPVMSYVTIAKKPPTLTDEAVINISKPIISIRPLGEERIVFAGYSDDVSKIKTNKGIDDLKKCGQETFAINEFYEQWYNEDYQTLDKLPLIGEMAPDIYLASGYNKWGITTAVLASLLIKDAIEKIPNQYTYLFNPKRSPKRIKQVFYVSKSVSTLVISKWRFTKQNINDLQKFCPHMGANLRYNAVDETYDCPCHGSRFHKNGTLINGPSKHNLKKK